MTFVTKPESDDVLVEDGSGMPVWWQPLTVNVGGGCSITGQFDFHQNNGWCLLLGGNRIFVVPMPRMRGPVLLDYRDPGRKVLALRHMAQPPEEQPSGKMAVFRGVPERLLAEFDRNCAVVHRAVRSDSRHDVLAQIADNERFNALVKLCTAAA